MRIIIYPENTESDIIEVPDNLNEEDLDDLACGWVADNVRGFWEIVDR